MTVPQLLKILDANRELIMRNNTYAVEHLKMLQADYNHIADDEVVMAIELGISLAEKNIYSNHKKAIENSLRVVNTYSHIKQSHYMARHYWVIGHIYAQQGQHQKAEEFLLQALHHADDGVVIKADVLNTLAMNEEFNTGCQGSPKAAAYMRQALGLLEGEEYEVARAVCLIGLGNVLVNGWDLDESLNVFQQAAEIYEKHFDLVNMAAAYCNIGTNYYRRKNYERAEVYIKKSVELRLKAGSPDDLGISYYNLAIVYIETSRLHEAYELLLKTREIEQQSGHKHNLDKTEQQLRELAALMNKDVAAA